MPADHSSRQDNKAREAKESLVAAARDLGFDGVRVASVRVLRDGVARDVASLLDQFLDAGMHGDMDWMANNRERRRDPLVLWPEARSIVMLAMSYAPAGDPRAILAERQRGAISVYAKGKDYHDVLKARLKELARRHAAETGAEVKVFVDTAPLMEKPLAAAAGLGWQGKHTNLVSRMHGSWLFLGALLTTAELPPDPGEADHCGSCRRCLDVCPTEAFPTPYRLDARRCIAYLTIEHKGHIPRAFRAPIANRVFGCDDCLAVCPWNKFAVAARETRFAARLETDDPPIAELIALDDAAFRARFAGTPVKRTGRDRFVRNALIAAGNSADRSLLPRIEELLADPSPLVRAMAVWAFVQLAPRDAIAHHQRRYLSREADASVQSEWAAALVEEAPSNG